MLLPVASGQDWASFQRLLDDAEERLGGSKQATARAIGITPSRYSKVYKGGQYGLNIENTLKLAILTGQPAVRVLRIAGHTTFADLLDATFPSQPPRIDPEIARALADAETATQVREFLKLPQGLRQLVARAPEGQTSDLRTKEQAGAPTRAPLQGTRTKSAAGRRR